jgi:hypothetical protein
MTQAAEGRLLDICVEETRECRPFFIALQGERMAGYPEKPAPA